MGDGYVEALRGTYSEVPESADYVMYWWHRAAELVRNGSIRRFGFIATNSLRQAFNRRVLAQHIGVPDGLSLMYAIPDHPWVDSADGADVRISMTVAERGERDGTLLRVVSESYGDEQGAQVDFQQRVGLIHPDLSIGPNVAAAVPLRANEGLSCRGVSLHGSGFIVTPEEAHALGLGRTPGLEDYIRPYRNGRDITARPRGLLVIDLFGLESTDVRTRFPEVYQWVWDRVKPERDHNNRSAYRDNWWIHGEPRSNFRPALRGLPRYISTVETAKHRFFLLLDATILPDNKLVNIASADAYVLGVLSSRIHVTWALAAGSRLGVGNDPVYVKSRCFEPFPFPDAMPERQTEIRDLAEALDNHRKRQQELHSDLTLTEMYNVLAKLRYDEPLTEADRRTHDAGLISILRDLHDQLDRAVFDAYGWPETLRDEEVLFRLVALNAERALEERNGVVRWLRPEFQRSPAGAQSGLGIAMEAEVTQNSVRARRNQWPAALSERVRAIRDLLVERKTPLTSGEVAKSFQRARSADVTAILDTLVSLGQARERSGMYSA
jgi:hypothetical protein